MMRYTCTSTTVRSAKPQGAMIEHVDMVNVFAQSDRFSFLGDDFDALAV